MERKLASIQTISDLQPIEGADFIEVATVKGWKLVIKKGEFALGDTVIYCEIDSFLPLLPEFEFLRKSSYRKMGDVEGFRLRTIKLRGQISQGLLLPLSVLQNKLPAPETGSDFTEILGIVKYEPPIPAQLSGVMRGYFPSFIPKTDEERIQNLADQYEVLKTTANYYVTEKLDGCSVTFYYNDGMFGVCSRNLDLLETAGNSLWSVARALDIEQKLSTLGNFALQGELIGEGIQGNPYKLKGQSVRFFNCFDINAQCHVSFSNFSDILKSLDLPCVPILHNEYSLPASIDMLLKEAEGKSELQSNAEREGIVIRSHDRLISFKVISNIFLLKEVS